MDLIASKQNALYQIALNQIGENCFQLFMPAEWDRSRQAFHMAGGAYGHEARCLFVWLGEGLQIRCSLPLSSSWHNYQTTCPYTQMCTCSPAAVKALWIEEVVDMVKLFAKKLTNIVRPCILFWLSHKVLLSILQRLLDVISVNRWAFNLAIAIGQH